MVPTDEKVPNLYKLEFRDYTEEISLYNNTIQLYTFIQTEI